MDNAVALVEAYLYVNGYFTVTEYPVIEGVRKGGFRVATDLDVMAFRFPHAGRLVPGARGEYGIFSPDPALRCPPDRADMLVGEVKEGRAELNRGARDPDVLRVMLARFGCCGLEDVEGIVKQLLRKGTAVVPAGHGVRLVAFGMTHEGDPPHGYHAVSLLHVMQFLEAYLREHWGVLHNAQFKHPAFGFLALLQKTLHGKSTGEEPS
ncbi:hypothetical protein Tel_11775 [Candidatus Tenderia electrophaga]|jgi:hypothetical protein|uniref:Uncharacterized protein n=1 Tax=Candidatus Tenderia electrophaga TaxID=1748243 RepID=A0A0S2TF28_9GAMM|nr:hypothetical protein Tel_11775 [Candidatus Tenderia electrophaga]